MDDKLIASPFPEFEINRSGDTLFSLADAIGGSFMSERQRQVSGLTRKIVADGIIEEASAVELHQEAKSAKLPFVAYLVHEKGISAEKIAVAAADEFTTPILDLDAFDTSALPEGIVSNELIRKNHAVPLISARQPAFCCSIGPNESTSALGYSVSDGYCDRRGVGSGRSTL